MNRTAGAALAAALLCAGCPLPQPLPDYPPGTVSPPRIMTERIRVNGELPLLSIIPVPLDCPGTEPSFKIDVVLHDDVALGATARWFIDYRPIPGEFTYDRQDPIAPPAETTQLEMAVPTFTFFPMASISPPSAGSVRTVELVVSTRFAENEEEGPLPYKTPAPGFETQLHRWVFQFVAGTEGCPP